MAIRFDAAADRIVLTSGLFNYNSAYTWVGWVYLTSDLNAQTTLLSASNNNVASINSDIVALDTDGTTLILSVAISGTPTVVSSGTSLSTGTWYHVGVVRTSSTNALLYLNGTSVATNTANVGARGAQSRLEIGGLTTSNLFRLDGRIGYQRIWTAALSQSEIAAEMNAVSALRTADLWGDWQHTNTGSTRVNDVSGNGRNWTAGGTLTDEANPTPTPAVAQWRNTTVYGGINTSHSVPRASTVDGDGLVLTAIMRATAAETFTTPSGWTQLYQQKHSTADLRIGVWARTASSEPSTTTLTTSDSRFVVAEMTAFAGTDTSDFIGNTSILETASGASTVPTTAISVGGSGRALLALAAMSKTGGWTMTPPSGLIERADHTQSDIVGSVATRNSPSAGSTGSLAFDMSPASTHVGSLGVLIEILPPGAGGGTAEITPTLLNVTPTVYTPARTTAVERTLTLLDVTATVHDPTVTSADSIAPALLDATPQVFTPTVQASAVTITPSLLDATPTVYPPSLATDVAVSITLLDATPTVYTPTVSAGGATVSPTLLDVTAEVFTPTLSTHATIAPALLDATASVLTPVVTPESVTVTLTLLDATPTVFTPTIAGEGALVVPFLDVTPTVFTPTVTSGATVSPALLDATPDLYTPTLTSHVERTLSLVDAVADVFAPGVQASAVTINLGLLNATATVYTPVVGEYNPDPSIPEPTVVLLDSNNLTSVVLLSTNRTRVALDTTNLTSTGVN